MGSKAFKKILPIVGAIGGSIVGGPVGGAIGSGLGTKVGGGSWGDALKSGALSYAGGKIGGWAGNTEIGKSIGLGGTIGDALGTATNAAGPQFMDAGLGSVIGDSASNTIGAGIANAGVGSTIGSYAANSLGSDMLASKPQTPKPAGFIPSQQAQQELPSSMSAFGALSPEQQSSNIATQGVYGGGAGPQEQSYFMNLMNRRLVDSTGHVDENMNDINPIENSYLSQLGLGGYGNSRDLLEAMSKWKAA